MKKVIGEIVLCIAVILLTGFVLVFAQPPAAPNAYELKTFIPPSPNAASLGKYTDIPISYHTGIPNISIPLYELKEGEVTLPISLSYHASGVRVAEVASWVGLGWTLNAGGVITRSVQHVPDEGPLPGKVNAPVGDYWADGGSYRTGYYKDGFTLPVGYEYVDNYPANTRFDLNARMTNNKIKDAASGNCDTEPDLFFFNVGGYSGKFLFKVDVENGKVSRTPHFIPRSDVRVEVLYGNLVMPTYPSGTEKRETFIGFILTTPDGFKYHFGGQNAIEYTGSQVSNVRNYAKSSPPILAPSSWYLTRIESPTGKHIEFEYTNDTFGYFDLAPEKCWGGDEYLSLGDQQVSRTAVNGVKLSRIYSGNEEIVFRSETIREDLGNYENSVGGELADRVTTKRLDRIEINRADGSAVKKFLFSYDYFRSGENSPLPKFIEDVSGLKASFTTDRNRLRLDKITEMSGDGSIVLPPHQFTYIEGSLPRRLSYQQDHWGYYNGAFNNRGLIAFHLAPRKNNRETNDQYTQIGTLKSIRYPMGGTTTFSYEPHEATMLVEDTQTFDPGRNYVADSWSVSGNGAVATTPFETVSTPFPNPCIKGVNCNTYYDVIAKFRAGSPTGGTYDLNFLDFDTKPALEIYKEGQPTPVISWTFAGLRDCVSGDLNCSLYKGGQPGSAFKEITRTFTINLQPGRYYTKAYRYEGTKSGSSYLFTGSINVPVPSERDKNYSPSMVMKLTKVGGLRIRSIVTSDGIGLSPNQERVFSYPKSGGSLFTKPRYLYPLQYLLTNPFGSVIEGDAFQQLWSSAGVEPMRNTQGNHIGYEWVKEEKPGNGYKIYKYDVREHPHHFDTNPYFKGNSFSYTSEARRYNYPVYPAPLDLERGNLLAEEIYDSRDRMVMSTYHTYESAADLLVLRASKIEYITTPLVGVYHVGFTHYPLFTSTNRVMTTTVYTTFDQDGSNPARVTTTYDYNGRGHLQATGITKTLDDVEYTDNLIFPPDYGLLTSDVAGIRNLQARNVINVPVEKYTVRRLRGQPGKVIDATLTQFKKETPLPEFVCSLKTVPISEAGFVKSNSKPGEFTLSSSYEKRQSYYQYDAAGNVSESSKTDDAHIVYLWGYSRTRPIAEVRNATLSLIFHTSFEEETSNTSDVSFTGRKSWMGSYSVPMVSPGTYKLTYWKKPAGSAEWQLVETIIKSATTIGEPNSLIDEVRLHPVDARMTTYTYDPSAGITSITDPNNVVTRYYYDKLQRLQSVKDHLGDLVKSFVYNHKNQ